MWRIDLTDEQVTGPVEVFNGQAYFTTFRSVTASGCDFGSAYIWGVHYKDAQTGSSSPTCTTPLCPKYGMRTVPTATTDPDAFNVGPFSNQVLNGVGIRQTPMCFTGAEEIDPFFSGRRYRITNQGTSTFEIVAAGQMGVMSIGDRLGRTARSISGAASASVFLSTADVL
jgi:hypothetical protein